MDERWQVNLFRLRLVLLPFLCLLLHPDLDFCWSLNAEGLALLGLREEVVRDQYNALSNCNSDDEEEDPCSWLGVDCCDGKVKSLIIDQVGDISSRKLLQATPIGSTIPDNELNSPASLPAPPLSPSPLPSASDLLSPSPSPFPSPTSMFLPPTPTELAFPVPENTPSVITAPPPFQSASIPQKKSSWSRNRAKWLLLGTIGTAVFIFILSLGILICRSNKVTIVRPWTTGLSGQLQKAFVTGVPKLKRSELETACEDFSNVIESSSNGKMFKGTLSSGVEIAVISTTVISAKDWSRHLEVQFRKKIDTLSKVNHKNFVNLLGYCKEDKPFTRMMVFEYAPNGTLFEHLHIKEAEHLGWSARLRIAMGVAYCLEHIHQLNPPVIPASLNSTAIYLSEDYAAKISGISFWNGAVSANIGAHGTELLDTPTSDKERNIYNFGLILLEMITGRLPYTVENGQLVDWALEYFRTKQPVKYMVDPILESFEVEKLEKLCKVIITCIHPDSTQRPTMREVTARLREITAMAPDGATPRLSPLWWAELEILSTASN